MEFALAMGFDLVAFLEPRKPALANLDVVDIERAAGIAVMWLVRPNRLQTWRVTNPIEQWPIAATCAASDTPFIWLPDDDRFFSPAHLSPRHRVAVRGFFRRFNVSAAITTPVHLDGHGVGFVSWFACGVESPAVDEWADIAPRLHRVARDFLAALPGLAAPEQGGGAADLSQREIECLRWSALGKSAEEIAELIGRSAETARFHLKNAVRKLGANNRVHAIALASYRHMLGDLSGLEP
jgi:LuxR family transcriptional regulator